MERYSLKAVGYYRACQTMPSTQAEENPVEGRSMTHQPPFRPDIRLRLRDLEVIYYGLAMTYLDAKESIELEAATEFIPGEVYTICVRANWIDHPNPKWTDKDGLPVQLGEFLVPTKFKEAWMATFKDSIDGMVALSNRQSESHENPKQLMEHFKDLSKGFWTDERIAEKIGCDPGSLVRLRAGVRGRESTLSRLANLMKQEYPVEFANLHWIHLRWPSRN